MAYKRRRRSRYGSRKRRRTSYRRGYRRRGYRRAYRKYVKSFFKPQKHKAAFRRPITAGVSSPIVPAPRNYGDVNWGSLGAILGAGLATYAGGRYLHNKFNNWHSQERQKAIEAQDDALDEQEQIAELMGQEGFYPGDPTFNKADAAFKTWSKYRDMVAANNKIRERDGLPTQPIKPFTASLLPYLSSHNKPKQDLK